MSENIKLTDNLIETQLELILISEGFVRSPQLRKFLRFVVESALKGEYARIKGYTIATEVFRREETFDPQSDPIVRIEAGRLRRRLAEYYDGAGRNDPVRVEIPKGAYKPVFRWQVPEASEPEIDREHLTKDNNTSTAGEQRMRKRPSVAVMPLVNLNNDEALDFFTYGIGEELSNHLSLIQGLFVVAHYSMMQYKSTVCDLKQVGRELDVQYIITGSIFRGDKRVRLTFQVTETQSGRQIWGQRFDIPLTASSLIKMQDEIMQQVVSSVAGIYGGLVQTMWKASRNKSVQNLTAYEAVLRQYYYNLKLSTDTYVAARSALKHAVKIDPYYARAWAMLGETYCDEYIYIGNEDNSLQNSQNFIDKAIDLDPNCQYAQYTKAFLSTLQKKRDAAITASETMLRLNPNAAFMVGAAGTWMGLVGEYEHGITLVQRSMQMAPLYPGWFHFIPFAQHFRSGDFEQALAEANKLNLPDWLWQPLTLAATLGQLGRIETAQRAYKHLLAIKPDFEAKADYFINALLMDEVLIEGLIEGLQKAGLKTSKSPEY